jgi:diguanylate cyclase (GGDEF)-like protein
MEPRLSEPTLGILRKMLEYMEPESLATPDTIEKFWRDELYDAGFAQTFIDIAVTYGFHWSQIVSDLFVDRFGGHNPHFSDAISPDFCGQNLKRLFWFVLSVYDKESPLAVQLREALVRDGFHFKPSSKADSFVPTELAQIPAKKALVSDLQQKLDQRALVAVLTMDLDGFKTVNDTLGHSEGDRCLIRVAQRMAEAILEKGKLYRPHADEFVVILPNFTKGEAAATAERIRAAVAADNRDSGLKITVSIGVVSSESGQADAKTLIAAAERTMHVAKEKKNFVALA